MSEKVGFDLMKGYHLILKENNRRGFQGKFDTFMSAKAMMSTSRVYAFFTLFLLVENDKKIGWDKEEIYGARIVKELKWMADQSYGLSHSTLYPILAKLEAEGLVYSERSKEEPRRRIYFITEKGKAEFEQQKQTFQQETLSSYVFYQRIYQRIYQ